MNARLMQFLRDEDGITAIEYGIIGGLIVVALFVAVGFLTGSDNTSGLKGIYNALGTKLTSVGTAVGS
ncbi:Flp family type IVb pilin [Collimonas sp. NPDC087041]|uniref:Flp family type IVb pilin n=1 Tax=Collimonas sp. NPDC087041 TaxID=3363960 RepID=UPI00380B718B